jgi:hypothetical protein
MLFTCRHFNHHSSEPKQRLVKLFLILDLGRSLSTDVSIVNLLFDLICSDFIFDVTISSTLVRLRRDGFRLLRRRATITSAVLSNDARSNTPLLLDVPPSLVPTSSPVSKDKSKVGGKWSSESGNSDLRGLSSRKTSIFGDSIKIEIALGHGLLVVSQTCFDVSHLSRLSGLCLFWRHDEFG